MQISARNQFEGRVRRLTVGPINAEGVLALPGGDHTSSARHGNRRTSERRTFFVRRSLTALRCPDRRIEDRLTTHSRPTVLRFR